MSADGLFAAAASALEHRDVNNVGEALRDLGRGLAATVDLLDGRPNDWTPGPALRWFAQQPGRSLLGDVVRAVAGEI